MANKSKTFKAMAMGDVMYFAAPNIDDAKEQMLALCGPMPEGLVGWSEADSLPVDEEYAADVLLSLANTQ